MKSIGDITFGLASDLHLDFAPVHQEFFEWRGDVLLLAGDIAEDDNLRKMDDFWSRVADMAAEVYMVCGNHEFYRSEIDVASEHIREYLSKYPNIRLLENEVVKTNGVNLFGATLWTDFDNSDPFSVMDAQAMLSDYRQIRFKKNGYRRIHPADIYNLHKQSLDKLRSSIMSSDGATVVMTHHGPSFQSIDAKYVGDSLNGAYVTELDEFILDSPQIKAWVHGHVHTYKDYQIGECRVMVNSRGYPGERNAGYGNYHVKQFRLGE